MSRSAWSGPFHAAGPLNSASALQLLAQSFQCSPPRIGRFLFVGVRLVVEVLAADRAEPGAVRAAEDLVGEGESNCVTRPCNEVELVVNHVLRPQLVGSLWVRRLILASRDRQLEHRVLETAEARPVQACPEAELED